jgi:membrane-bound metal-dependent hydrolase YbcI (DUF457 family)
MNILKDRRGLNFRGHVIFSISLALFMIFILEKYTKVDLASLLIYIPFFLLGAVAVDKFIEKPTFSKHRSFFHSARLFWIVLVILIPLTFYKGLESSKWFFATAFLLGHESHIIGDFLTSRLPS